MERDLNFTTKNPDFENTIRERLKGQHFMNHMGARLTVIEKAYTEARLDIKEQHLQHSGFVHGGVTATMCDLVTGFAAVTLVAPDETVVTADLKVSYFNPGDGEEVIAMGRVLKPGAMLHFCEGEVWVSKKGTLTKIAHCTAIMAVVKNMVKRSE